MHRIEHTIKESELVDYFDKENLLSSRVIIICGHYMLMRDSITGKLKPVIYEELTEDVDKAFARTRTKNFPLKSFKLGIIVYLNLLCRKMVVKCAMLVNDDSVNHKSFSNDFSYYAYMRKYGKKLRKEYFSDDENLPATYKDLLKDHGLSKENVFETFASDFEDNTKENSNTIFISERRLCLKFKKNIGNKGPLENLFKSSISYNDENSIQNLTIKDSVLKNVCLIEEGLCNCRGKTFQLYYELISKGYNSIIFFVPDNCMEQVNASSELICIMKEFSSVDLTIINVWNVESNPNRIVADKKLFISQFNNSKPYGHPS